MTDPLAALTLVPRLPGAAPAIDAGGPANVPVFAGDFANLLARLVAVPPPVTVAAVPSVVSQPVTPEVADERQIFAAPGARLPVEATAGPLPAAVAPEPPTPARVSRRPAVTAAPPERSPAAIAAPDQGVRRIAVPKRDAAIAAAPDDDLPEARLEPALAWLLPPVAPPPVGSVAPPRGASAVLVDRPTTVGVAPRTDGALAAAAPTVVTPFEPIVAGAPPAVVPPGEPVTRAQLLGSAAVPPTAPPARAAEPSAADPQRPVATLPAPADRPRGDVPSLAPDLRGTIVTPDPARAVTLPNAAAGPVVIPASAPVVVPGSVPMPAGAVSASLDPPRSAAAMPAVTAPIASAGPTTTAASRRPLPVDPAPPVRAAGRAEPAASARFAPVRDPARPASPLVPDRAASAPLTGPALAPFQAATERPDPSAIAAAPRPEASLAVADNPTPIAATPPAAVRPTGDAAQAGIDLSRDPGLHRMIDRIETLRDAADATDTRIRLIPDRLGPVDVAVRRADGPGGEAVHVHFSAPEAATRQLLADAQPRLAELAEARGIRIERATVDGGAHSEGGQRHPPAWAAPQATANRLNRPVEDDESIDHRIA